MTFAYQTSFNNFKLYLSSRFPFVPLFLYSLITSLAISSFLSKDNYFKVIVVAFIYLLFFFHLRVMDEFKDFAYDNKNHEDRPVQIGLISLDFIKRLGLINFLIMSFLALIVSFGNVFLIFLFAMGYTTLMYKEFFVPDYLRNRPMLYLFSHEVVMIPLFIFFYSAINNNLWLFDNTEKASAFIYTLIPVILIEIGRKLEHRHNKKGEETNDTYVYLWGTGKSIRIFAGLIFISGLISVNIQDFNIYFSNGIIFISLIIFLGSYLFPKIIVKSNMALTSLIALTLPLLLTL